MLSLSADSRARLLDLVRAEAQRLPALSLAITTADGPLFYAQAGKFDALDPAGPDVSDDSICWFASTTKLLTSIAALRLVDQGVIALDTPVSKYLPQLATPLRYIASVDDSGQPAYGSTDAEITVLMLMNQTAGFGAEFGPKVTAWKKQTEVGGGFVNSCKLANLVNTPICNPPGTTWEYGNGHEWLGLLVQEVSGQPLEDFLQQHLFRPLGLRNTTFYPFAEADQASRLVPLRWRQENADGSAEYQALVDQDPGLTLPRRRSEIEYPVGGGGIYSTTSDYATILSHLLACRLRRTPSSILSAESIDSLFVGTLPEGAIDQDHNAGIYAMLRVERGLGAVDWSTALCLYQGSGQKAGWGRYPGSVGWAGAGGTEYWLDERAGIAVVMTTQVLPVFSKAVAAMKERLERAIYEELAI